MRKRQVAGLMLALGLVASLGQAGLFSDWQRTLTITFTNCPVGATLTNFPALVVLGPQIPSFRYYQFLSGVNADLRFTDATGSQELAYEVDEWNQGGRSYVWVKVPVLTNGASIVAHWGKSGVAAPACTTNGATWSEGYAGVWHMRTIDARDSTSNGNHGVAVSSPTVGTGVVDGAVNFPGVNEYVSATNAGGLNMADALTLSMWIKPDRTDNKGVIMKGPLTGSQGVYSLSLYQDKVFFRLNGSVTEGDGQVSSTPSIATNEWQHVCATYDRSYQKTYLNGQFNTQQAYTTAISTNDSSLVIGGYYGGNVLFDGVMDEVRVDNIARSSNWVWASYMTMVSNTFFTSYGSVSGGETFPLWRCRLTITFTNCPAGATLTNFPALVVLGPQIPSFRYNYFESGVNADLRFTDDTGEELAYEVDEWNQSGSSYIWVKVPVLTNGASIVAHWGKSGVTAPAYTTNGTTWSEGYAGVWHMRTIDARDSTSNGNHGVAVSSPTVGTGVVDGAVNFPGVDAYVNATNAAGLNMTNALTLSMWIKPDSTANKGAIMKGPLTGSQGAYNIMLYQDMVYFNVNGYALVSTPSIATNEWQHVCATYDRAYQKTYLNGQFNMQQAYTAAISTNDSSLVIGGYYGASWLFDGVMDEVRVDSVARSSNWVWASYMTMASNALFQGYGQVERMHVGTIIGFR